MHHLMLYTVLVTLGSVTISLSTLPAVEMRHRSINATPNREHSNFGRNYPKISLSDLQVYEKIHGRYVQVTRQDGLQAVSEKKLQRYRSSTDNKNTIRQHLQGLLLNYNELLTMIKTNRNPIISHTDGSVLHDLSSFFMHFVSPKSVTVGSVQRPAQNTFGINCSANLIENEEDTRHSAQINIRTHDGTRPMTVPNILNSHRRVPRTAHHSSSRQADMNRDMFASSSDFFNLSPTTAYFADFDTKFKNLSTRINNFSIEELQPDSGTSRFQFQNMVQNELDDNRKFGLVISLFNREDARNYVHAVNNRQKERNGDTNGRHFRHRRTPRNYSLRQNSTNLFGNATNGVFSRLPQYVEESRGAMSVSKRVLRQFNPPTTSGDDLFHNPSQKYQHQPVANSESLTVSHEYQQLPEHVPNSEHRSLQGITGNLVTAHRQKDLTFEGSGQHSDPVGGEDTGGQVSNGDSSLQVEDSAAAEDVVTLSSPEDVLSRYPGQDDYICEYKNATVICLFVICML